MYLILQGVGDGSQPLMSRFYGEDNKKRGPHYADHGVCSRRVMGVALAVLLYCAETGSEFCLEHPKSVSLAVGTDLYIFLAAVPFLAFLRVTTARLLRHRTDPIFLYDRLWRTHIFSPFAPVLPAWMGLKASGGARPGAQILTALMGWGLKLWSDRVHGYTADAV